MKKRKNWRTKLGALISAIGGAYGLYQPAHCALALFIIAIGSAVGNFFSVDVVASNGDHDDNEKVIAADSGPKPPVP